jgi:hypothetical protein
VRKSGSWGMMTTLASEEPTSTRNLPRGVDRAPPAATSISSKIGKQSQRLFPIGLTLGGDGKRARTALDELGPKMLLKILE